MYLSRIFYIAIIALITSSCSSMYDAWQGYDDIEPVVQKKNTIKNSTQGKRELDEVVVRATLENETAKSEASLREVTQDQIDEIYARAGIKSPKNITSDMAVPKTPSKVNQDLVSYKVAEITPTPVSTSTAKRPQKLGQLFDDEIAATSDVITSPDFEAIIPVAVDSSDTIVIGDEAPMKDDAEGIVINEDVLSMDNMDINVSHDDYNMQFLAEEIKYNKDSHRLSPKDISKLKSIATQYKQGDYKLKVIGYTTSSTSQDDEASEELAETRATKVTNALKRLGVKATDIETTSQVINDSDDEKKDITEIYFFN